MEPFYLNHSGLEDHRTHLCRSKFRRHSISYYKNKELIISSLVLHEDCEITAGNFDLQKGSNIWILFFLYLWYIPFSQFSFHISLAFFPFLFPVPFFFLLWFLTLVHSSLVLIMISFSYWENATDSSSEWPETRQIL